MYCADGRLDSRWLDLCSRVPRSPPAPSLRRSSAYASSHHHHHQSGFHPRQSSSTNGCDVHSPGGDRRTTDVKSPRSGSSQVLPALRRLLLKPLAATDWIQPASSVHKPSTKPSSFARDPADSPPTLKPEPLSIAPKIKQEFVVNSQHNCNGIPHRLKTTSGLCSTPEVHELRPPMKRRSELCAYVNSSDSTSGGDDGKIATNTGSNGECTVINGSQSEPEVERCPSDLSSAPPDITVDQSPNSGITQCNEGVVVERRADECFTHAPRKRFRYEFLSYVDANSQVTAAAVGQTGNGNDVINLSTSTRVSSDCGRTRDVAIQCVLTAEDNEDEADLEMPGFKDSRRPVHCRLPSTCGCSTTPDTLSSFCWYCGIVFDDDVLHAIHMGCHSVADKFVCNVCGLACGDRYGFNSHLVRGHIQATAVSEQPAPGSVLPLQLPSTARLVPQTTSLPAPTSSADGHRWTTYE